eukprot:scaffold470252_cov43-Prasinocladus_malaysianus.AAC.2
MFDTTGGLASADWYAEVGDEFVAYDYGVAIANVQLSLAELRQDVRMLIANAVDKIGQRLATTRYEHSGESLERSRALWSATAAAFYDA